MPIQNKEHEETRALRKLRDVIRYLMKEGKARKDRILEQEKMDMKSG